MKFIALLDCNNFFVSCERVFRPELRGKPVVVLSSNDGCIVSRSNEAKALGIPMGAPVFKWREEVEKYNVKLFSSNFSLYSDMSKRVMSILKECVKHVEIYSVDEAFFLIDGGANFAADLKNHVERCTGIPVSIGIGENKTRAKMATEIAKKNLEHDGAFDLASKNPDEQIEMLKKFPIEDIWGIGRSLSRFLKDNFIYTAKEFTEVPDTWVKSHMGLHGLLKLRECRGEIFENAYGRFEATGEHVKKSIISSRSFGKKLYDFEEIWNALSYHVCRIGEDLRSQNSVTNVLSIYLYKVVTRDEAGSTGRVQVSRTMELPRPTSYTPELLKYAYELFIDIYEKDAAYKKAGAAVGELSQADTKQLDLFEDTLCAKIGKPSENHYLNDGKKQNLMNTLDALHQKWGDRFDISCFPRLRTWVSRKENRSPLYTTSWDELLTIS